MLPIQNSDDKDLMLMQTKWASQLNPLLAGLISQGLLLPQTALVVGANVVNHRLQRNLIGWFIVRQRALASVYDTQDLNQFPALTLTLQSSAIVTVDLFVF